MPAVKALRIVLGITGGIATGKSAVLQEFKSRGIPTLSSDELAHQCLKKGHPAYFKVLRRFGRAILGSRLEIDRKRLGAIIFSKPAERKWLERQIHPWVIRRLRSFIRKKRGVVALDIPLLYEAKLEGLVDAVVVVWCPEKLQLARLEKRDGLSTEEALRRIRAQLPLSLKKKRADYVITNDQTLLTLRRQVDALLAAVQRPRSKMA
jgi:dephospho-CoA kinase